MGVPPDEPPGETSTEAQPGTAHGSGDNDMNDDANIDDDLGMDVDLVTSDETSLFLLMQLGRGGRAYNRERRSAHRRIVSELFSPPRITGYLSEFPNEHLAPGFALDLTVRDPDDGEPWDFDRADKRAKARELFFKQQPLFLIASPVCRAWCSWQALNAVMHGNDMVLRRERTRSLVHLRFLAELYHEQIKAGRYFVHEHPEWASSWTLPVIQGVLAHATVERVRADQCQYGAHVRHGGLLGAPIKKPTGFMTNSPEVLRQLNRRCRGHGGECSRPQGGHHALCSGKAARDAARYPRGLVRAFIRGFINQMKVDGLLVQGLCRLQPACDEDVDQRENWLMHLDKESDDATAETPKTPGRAAQSMYCSGKYRDDLTKQPLVDSLVHEARRK